MGCVAPVRTAENWRRPQGAPSPKALSFSARTPALRPVSYRRSFPRVNGVRHAGEYCLALSFTDGTSSEIDLKGRIAGRGGVFRPLQDIEFFKQVHVDPKRGPSSGPMASTSALMSCTAWLQASRFGFRNQLEAGRRRYLGFQARNRPLTCSSESR